MTKNKGMSATVLKRADLSHDEMRASTMDGITVNHSRVVVIDDRYSETGNYDMPSVKIMSRYRFSNNEDDYTFSIPVLPAHFPAYNWISKQLKFAMGGNFIFIDSAYRFFNKQLKHPVPVHDRNERGLHYKKLVKLYRVAFENIHFSFFTIPQLRSQKMTDTQKRRYLQRVWFWYVRHGNELNFSNLYIDIPMIVSAWRDCENDIHSHAIVRFKKLNWGRKNHHVSLWSYHLGTEISSLGDTYKEAYADAYRHLRIRIKNSGGE